MTLDDLERPKRHCGRNKIKFYRAYTEKIDENRPYYKRQNVVTSLKIFGEELG